MTGQGTKELEIEDVDGFVYGFEAGFDSHIPAWS